MDAARALVSHIAVLLTSQLVTTILGFLTVILLPIYLGDVRLGEFAFAQSVCTVLGAVTVAGTNLYIAREVASDRRRLPQLIAAGLVVRAPVWAVLGLAIWLYFTLRGAPREAMVVLAMLFAVTLVNVLNGVLASALQGLEEMRWRSVSAVVTSVVVFVLGLPLLLVTHSAAWFCGALLAGAVAGAAINAWYFVARKLPLGVPSAAACRELAFGAAPFLGLAIAQGVYSQIDVVFTGLMTNDATVGWFAAAARLSTAVLLVPVVITAALLPVLTRLGPEHPAGREALRRTLNATLLLAMPMAAGVSAVGEQLFAFLHYPESFSHSLPILVLLSASWVATAVAMVLACAVIAANRQRAWAIATVAMLLVFGALNLVLIPVTQRLWANGGIGAALANLIAEVAFVVIALAMFKQPVAGRREWIYFLRVSGAMLGMILVVRLAGHLWLPLLIALGVLAYAALTVALRTVTPSDVRLVVGLLRAGRGADKVWTMPEVELEPAPATDEPVGGAVRSAG